MQHPDTLHVPAMEPGSDATQGHDAKGSMTIITIEEAGKYDGQEVTIRGLQGDLMPRQKLTAEIVSSDGALQRVPLLCRIDTLDELDYYRNGGILHYVLRKLAA